MLYTNGENLRTILTNDQKKIVLYVLSDHNQHSIHTSLSCVYIKTQDGEYYSSFDHPDYPTQSAEGLVINNAYTIDIKELLNVGVTVNNCIDLLQFHEMPDRSTLQHFYKVKLGNVTNINRVIPVYDHVNHMKGMVKQLGITTKHSARTVHSDRYYKMYHQMMPYVFSQLERRGVPVNPELFAHHYGEDKQHLIRENRVYTSYNLYTKTGRPSNTHGGINYAALNKTDGSRQAFASDKLLVNIDFNSYHLHLICNKLDIQIPDDLHSWLGKQYFGTENLTSDQYQESKKITFKNLYGYELEERVKHIDLFKQVEQLQETLWIQYQQSGFLLTDYHNTIVVDNPSKNKVFNYYIQSLETETNVRQLYNLIRDNLTPVLYTYDSMVFEITREDAERTRDLLKEKLLFPYNVNVGHDLDF